MSTVRLRRLKADYEKLKEYVRLHPRVRLLQHEGDPPERYQLEYRVRSLRRVNGDLQPVLSHTVEIALPRNYPRTPPQCRMLSPVFHPNIAPHAICVGDHWGAGESLRSIVVRIGEMLAYQSYNVKSPLNGEAAKWVEENKAQLPLDAVSLLVEEPGGRPDSVPAVGAPAGPRGADGAGNSVAPTATATAKIRVACPHCAAAFTVPAEARGRRARCGKCKEQFVVGPPASAPSASQPAQEAS